MDQIAEHVVAYLTLPTRGTDPRLAERANQQLERGLVDASRLRLHQRGEDPVALTSFCGLVAEVDMLASERRQLAHDLGMTQEDDGLNERETGL